jgi:hypothetical protein
VVGLTSYVLIPFVTPEISMTEYNMERMIPIQVLWSGAPFWESVLNLILKFLVYFEPAMLSIFIWSAGIAIKDDKIAEAGHGRAEMALGTFFIIMTYHLLSLCGASPIIVNVMRVVYGLWFLFHIIFLLQLAMLLMKFRAVLYDKIHPRFELEEEEKEDEDEEEEEDQRPRKKKKK